MMKERYQAYDLQKRLHEIKDLMEPYQVDAVRFNKTFKRTLTEAPVGAGKTLIGWTSALALEPEKILIVCSRNALYTWIKELDKWFPGLFNTTQHPNKKVMGDVLVIDGQPSERLIQWTSKAPIKITTFGKLLNDLHHAVKCGFDVIIVDEAHRARNRKAKIHAAVKDIMKPIVGLDRFPSVVELTGTPGDKGIQHLWGYFNQLDPKFFSSYWKFVSAFCDVTDGMYGKEIIGPKNTKAFASTIRPYFNKISVEDTKLEKVRRHLVPLQMSSKLADVYNTFDAEMIAATVEDQGLLLAKTSLDKTVKLRQLLTYPGQFFPSLGLGDLLPWIIDKIEDDDSNQMKHSIIFTPFRANLDVYKSALEDRFQNTVITLYGGMDPKLQQERIAECIRVRGMAVCTTLYAQSFEFPEMGTAFMAGYEWSADAMEQAEGRIRRLISKSIANAYYPQFMGTIDEMLIHVLNRKVTDLNVLFQDYKRMRLIL